ncbi:NADH-quinone oxidoreductase subunit B family protein [Telmatospirillum siberiense]|uniref:Hydrogenase n=1 Tax=Telmatospirillum siberiense TaxID=382514 RepID=A0A2N3PPN2_9PROT|nr:NADH-quinone oxidoreductase subunit B family protein [Telmatospirillum siberiense]PKU22362.1 hydrogenase [Telmatospirillum siberiense]
MSAFISPNDLTVQPGGLSMAADVARMKGSLLNNIRRSAYVYRVDCGGCNGCEIEIFAAITPLFDAERFGIKVVASPRHADILLFTGAVTRSMRMPALRAYEAAPDPKIVVSYGACGCSGGIFHDLYCVWGGTDKIVPVDVYIPGCPPTPPATIYGFAVALGLLEQKLKAETHVEAEGEAAPLAHPSIPYDLRVQLERQARQMAGYRQGRTIVEEFLSVLEARDATPVERRIAKLAGGEGDPRRAEIFAELAGTFSRMLTGGTP